MSFEFDVSSLTPVICSRCALPMKSYIDHPNRRARSVCPRCEDSSVKLKYNKILSYELKPKTEREKKVYREQYAKEWD